MSKLNEAARLIAETAAEMNETVTVCECCGHKKWEDYEQRQTAQVLREMAAKVRRWDRKLEPQSGAGGGEG